MDENRDLPFDRLAAVVNRPEWDVFLILVAQEESKCYDRLERCDVDNLKKIQGELSIFKNILTLREQVGNHIKSRGTKTQS